MKFALCGCGATNPEKAVRISRALFVSSGDASTSLKMIRGREMGNASSRNIQHWTVSTLYNQTPLIYASKRNWFLGLPRLIYPSTIRLRALLNAIPQDSLVSGALWILFEIEAPDHIKEDIMIILISMLVYILETHHPTIDIHPDARDFLTYHVSSRSVDRYIRETQMYMTLRQQMSHIIIRSFMYNAGLPMEIATTATSQQMKLIISVCNPRIGQLDQTYYTTQSSTGGIIPINQSVNATDEIVFSIYLGRTLVSRFQTIGFALMDQQRGPLKLYRDDLNEHEFFCDDVPDTFFFEVFAECLQWMAPSEGGATSSVVAGHGTQFTADDSERMRTVASRLHPQSGVQLTNEEKCAIILTALPSYSFRPLEKQIGESDDDFTLRTQCQVCLGDYEGGEEVRALPCMHVFHAACVESWLHVRIQCPNCCADIADLLAADAATDENRSLQTENVI